MDRRWKIAVMLADAMVPVPNWESFDRLEVAVERAWEWAESGRARWVKVYKADDERDVRAFWKLEDGWSRLSRTAAGVLGGRCI